VLKQLLCSNERWSESILECS